jgi:hypothetical protein
MLVKTGWLGAAALCLGVYGCGTGGGSGGAPLDGGAAFGGAGGALGGGAGMGGAAGAGGAAGSGAAGGSSSKCSGIEITSSGNLDLDAKSVLVSGAVSLNGGAFPDLGDYRGALYFDNLDTGDRLDLDLGVSGPASYAARIPPGQYDIGYEGNGSGCDTPGWPLPCNDGTLLKNIAISGDGALDVDVPAVHVQGGVAINGQAMPAASGDRGQLEFDLDGGGSAYTASFGPSGPASYQIALLAGSYTIRWSGSSSLCESGGVSPVPCNYGPVLKGVSLTSDGALDVDVPTVHVQGTVAVNGQAMPSANGDRGQLEFDLDGGGSAYTKGFGASGPGSYQMTLLSGSYSVRWSGSSSLCESGAGSPVPCNDGPVLKGVSLTSDGALDVDVPTVHVQGSVAINGQPMPGASGDRGSIEFDLDGGGSATTKSFGPSGAASYQITLLSGSYSLHWDGSSSLCDADTPSPVPCNDGPVMKNVSLTSDGALDVNVPAVHVEGSVRINGQAMPNADGNRGSLEFELDGGSSGYTKDFASTGAASYQLTLLAGGYTVSWDGNSSLCDAETPSPVPCNYGPVLENLALMSDGALDVDVPTVTVNGNLTLDGQPLPPADTDRGNLDFSLVNGGSAASRSFLGSGPTSYQVTLLAGRYVVSHRSSSDLCAPGSPLGIPCLDQVLAGCP